MSKRKTIEDGFGSSCTTCPHPLCDLQVVRPGKFQCDDWCDHVDAMGDLEVSEEHIAKLLEHIAWLTAELNRRWEADDE